jgi:ectoine hydroxylase-related dioxygenase (phytanoyl-CoA dioxygenase family)
VKTIASAIDAVGFAIAEGIVGDREIDALAEALASAGLSRSRAGVRHAMRSAAVAAFARDARLVRVACGVLGQGAVPYRATVFDKSPTSNWLVVWHQDTALPLLRRQDVSGWGPWSEKAGVVYAHAPASALDRILALRIHLDDSTESNGPLRVLPGTHRHGVLSDEAMQARARECEPIDCLVARGGVLAMRPLIIHASSKSRTDAPRRVLHIEYAASMTVGEGLELAIA